MGFYYTDFIRFLSFIIITIAQILLGVFLLYHGSETLKFFAVILLIIEVFVLVRLYLRVSNIRQLSGT